MSPAELLACARRKVPGVNLSTVYRHLVGLHASGGVVKVTLPGAAARYEAVCATHGSQVADRWHGGGHPAAVVSPAVAVAVADGKADVVPHGHHPHHHHHFHCGVCDRVFPLHTCPGSMRELAPPGFDVDSHDVTLYGRCADCASVVAAP